MLSVLLPVGPFLILLPAFLLDPVTLLPRARKWVRKWIPVVWPPGCHLGGGERLAGFSDGLPFGPYVPLALGGWLSAWYQSPNRVSGGELTGGGDQL